MARVSLPGEERERVVFVRHALPGEEVVIEITEGAERDRFWRADAIEILTPSPDRVEAPCAVAGPGGCGGCDFQHVRLPRQRELKAEVVAEQLRRLASIDWPVEVEEVAGDLPEQAAGLRWRTRVRYVDTDEGARGMRRHRSHDVVAVDDCLIAHPQARTPRPGTREETVTAVGRRRTFEVAADGFWQVHPGAPGALVDAVMGLLAPAPGETALDLYGGVGLFASFLADAVGESGRVLSVEGDRAASGYAEGNLATEPAEVEVRCGDVASVFSARPEGESADIVVLDPPREGAGRKVVDEVVRREPRAIAYVACDPAALARDVSYFAGSGYHLQALRAFDLFPMTHHVECVALLTRTGSDLH